MRKRCEKSVVLSVKGCPKYSTGGLSILLSQAQLWPAQWDASILVRHDALNRRDHAVCSQPTLMTLPARTKAEDGAQPLSISIRRVIFIRKPVLLFEILYVRNELGISPCHSPFLSSPSPLLNRLFLSFLPVHHRWK